MIENITVGQWDTLANEELLAETVRALQANNFTVMVAESAAEAKNIVLQQLPEGAEVFTARSATLAASGIDAEIDNSGRYVSVRNKIMALNRETDADEIRCLGSSPEYVVGSVHAVTQQGQVIIASYGGSQMASYVYGAKQVIWVVGTQKLVKSLDDGIRRIEEYSLPLESERLQEMAGIPSQVAKLLIFRKEARPNRVTMILVKENLGF